MDSGQDSHVWVRPSQNLRFEVSEEQTVSEELTTEKQTLQVSTLICQIRM